jgi:hypothetical protein
MRSFISISFLALAACKPAADIRSGELAMCLTNDGGTAVHSTATASWDVTGTVRNVTELDGSANAMLDCAEDAAYSVDIQKTDGTTWTIAYGIIDQAGTQAAPMLDLSEGDTVNLLFRQIENETPARGLVLIDGEGLVAAMDNGISGGALDADAVEGLMVRRGLDVGQNKEDCGKRAGSQIEFLTGATVSLEPFTVSKVQLEQNTFDVYAISAFYWNKAQCAESVDELAWAVFR